MALLTVDNPPEKLDEPMADLIARAKAIIAGQIPPPEVETPTFITELLRKEFARCEPPPTAEAIRMLENDMTIQHVYGTTAILYLCLAGHCRSVLVAGSSQILAVLAELTDEESAKIVVGTP